MDAVQVASRNKVENELLGLQTRLTKEEQHLLASMLLFAGEDEVEGHMMPPMSSFDYSQRHQDELLREAAYIHDVKEAEAGKPSAWARMKIGLGEFLVTTGRKLAARPAAKLSPTHAATD